MGERKVLNKYVPWNFDPDKASKIKLQNVGQYTVRNMLPFTVRCNSCGEFMYQGKKFNTRTEIAQGEDYLGIKIYRFYFKCTGCGCEFTIKTDPESGGYVTESGATRNASLWKNERQLELEEKMKEKEEEEMDAIQSLESRTEESRREMDIYDTLDMIQEQQRKNLTTNPDEALNQYWERKQSNNQKEIESKEDEETNKEDEEEFRKLIQEKKAENRNKGLEEIKNAFGPKITKEKEEKTLKVLPNGLVLKKKKKSGKSKEPKKLSLVNY